MDSESDESVDVDDGDARGAVDDGPLVFKLSPPRPRALTPGMSARRAAARHERAAAAARRPLPLRERRPAFWRLRIAVAAVRAVSRLTSLLTWARCVALSRARAARARGREWRRAIAAEAAADAAALEPPGGGSAGAARVPAEAASKPRAELFRNLWIIRVRAALRLAPEERSDEALDRALATLESRVTWRPWRELDAGDRRELLAAAEVVSAPGGTVLAHAGGPCDAVWLVLRGEVRAFADMEPGESFVRAVADAADVARGAAAAIEPLRMALDETVVDAVSGASSASLAELMDLAAARLRRWADAACALAAAPPNPLGREAAQRSLAAEAAAAATQLAALIAVTNGEGVVPGSGRSLWSQGRWPVGSPTGMGGTPRGGGSGAGTPRGRGAAPGVDESPRTLARRAALTAELRTAMRAGRDGLLSFAQTTAATAGRHVETHGQGAFVGEAAALSPELLHVYTSVVRDARAPPGARARSGAGRGGGGGAGRRPLAHR